MSLLFVSFLLIEISGSVKPDADHHHDHQIAPENIVLPAPLVPGLYVFGDSQVDTGLNTNLDTLMTATYKPYGIDFTIGATGRFSNGAVITDFIGHDLQLPTTLTYGAYKSLDEVVTSGFSYASASAGILHETGHGLGENWSMEKQIAMFNKTVHENLRRHINSTELPKYLSECIFLVFIGASDYEINFLQVYYNTSKKYTNEEFGSLLAMKLAYQLKALYKLGARRIVVFEIGPIGCYPASLKVFEPQTKCAEDINEMVMIFNRNLHIKIEALRSKLKDATILIAEMYGLIRDMIDRPSSYGFTDIRNTCCEVGRDGIGLCMPGVDVCPNRRTNLFWDDHHLTEAANVIIADKCFKDSNFCSPKGIRGVIFSGQTHRPGFSYFLFVVLIAGNFCFHKILGF